MSDLQAIGLGVVWLALVAAAARWGIPLAAGWLSRRHVAEIHDAHLEALARIHRRAQLNRADLYRSHLSVVAGGREARAAPSITSSRAAPPRPPAATTIEGGNRP